MADYFQRGSIYEDIQKMNKLELRIENTDNESNSIQ